jgi:hypothetical protein
MKSTVDVENIVDGKIPVRRTTERDNYVATVVSIVPFPIREEKPGIYPGSFIIPASENDEVVLLVVGESIYHVEIDERRSITVKCSPNDIARAIVDDYAKSNLAYSVIKKAGPGIFWLPGRYTVEQIENNHSDLLEAARMTQKNWFMELIQMADDDWEKTRQHKTISDTQRHAAKSLGMERPWLIKLQAPTMSTVNCVACQTVISPEAVICPSCNCIIDKEKWEGLNFSK